MSNLMDVSSQMHPKRFVSPYTEKALQLCMVFSACYTKNLVFVNTFKTPLIFQNVANSTVSEDKQIEKQKRIKLIFNRKND